MSLQITEQIITHYIEQHVLVEVEKTMYKRIQLTQNQIKFDRD